MIPARVDLIIFCPGILMISRFAFELVVGGQSCRIKGFFPPDGQKRSLGVFTDRFAGQALPFVPNAATCCLSLLRNPGIPPFLLHELP